MKAVAYFESLAIDDPRALQDVELPEPLPGPRDLLVEVRAISVNPVDTKVRRNTQPEGGQPKVLGWDVAGVVVGVGSEVSLFKVGDEVFYAGSIARAGGNSERHLVDERIVGRKPRSLSFAEAAALPLTAITAWELLFDRLGATEGGGAGQQDEGDHRHHDPEGLAAGRLVGGAGEAVLDGGFHGPATPCAVQGCILTDIGRAPDVAASSP